MKKRILKKSATHLVAVGLILTMMIPSASLSTFANSDIESEKIVEIENREATENTGPDNAAAALFYKFQKTSQTTDQTSAPVLKVSPDVTGVGTISATMTKSTHRSLSVSLSAGKESKVMASISGSFGKTLKNKLGITLQKKYHKKGYMAFKPYRVKVTGYLKTYNSAILHVNGGLISSQYITARYPKKLASGFAEGHYYIKYY